MKGEAKGGDVVFTCTVAAGSFHPCASVDLPFPFHLLSIQSDAPEDFIGHEWSNIFSVRAKIADKYEKRESKLYLGYHV